jgi:flagellar protein FlaG
MVMEIQARTAPIADLGAQARIAPATLTKSEAPAHVLKPTQTAEVRVDSERMRKNLDQAIQQLNETMRDGGRNLSFAMDDTLGVPVILVKKQDTGEVIRQIPNEVVIKVAHNLDAIKGLLLNKQI